MTTSAVVTPARSSSRPARMVVRESPVARSTMAIRRPPTASASAPATGRRVPSAGRALWQPFTR